MKKLNYLLLAAFMLIVSTSVNAQTVDEIIDNYMENTGGVENWENVEGIKIIYLDDSDVIRHQVVKRIIEAYKNSEHTN